jgi:hypothetical protein
MSDLEKETVTDSTELKHTEADQEPTNTTADNNGNSTEEDKVDSRENKTLNTRALTFFFKKNKGIRSHETARQRNGG